MGRNGGHTHLPCLCGGNRTLDVGKAGARHSVNDLTRSGVSNFVDSAVGRGRPPAVYQHLHGYCSLDRAGCFGASKNMNALPKYRIDSDQAACWTTDLVGAQTMSTKPQKWPTDRPLRIRERQLRLPAKFGEQAGPETWLELQPRCTH